MTDWLTTHRQGVQSIDGAILAAERLARLLDSVGHESLAGQVGCIARSAREGRDMVQKSVRDRLDRDIAAQREQMGNVLTTLVDRAKESTT